MLTFQVYLTCASSSSYFFPAPKGLPPPVLSAVSTSELRVSWSAPSQPNGDIISYTIVLGDRSINTQMVVPGSTVIDGLQPYTVYNVAVCNSISMNSLEIYLLFFFFFFVECVDYTLRRLGTRNRQPTFSKLYRKRKKLMYSVKNSGARVLINILTQNIIPNHMLSLIRENNS